MDEADILKRFEGRRGRDLVATLAAEFSRLEGRLDELRDGLRALEAMMRAGEIGGSGAAAQAKLPRRVVIGAAENLSAGDGFYGVEYTDTHTPYRWTGPGRSFSFRVFIDRTAPVDLTLEAISVVDHARQAAITLSVDGESVPCQVAPDGGGLRIGAALARRTDSGPTDLVFLVPWVSPVPTSQDSRVLGLAFRQLTLETAAG